MATRSHHQIEALIWHGRLELEETKALFKTKTHVLRYLPSKNTLSYADRSALPGTGTDASPLKGAAKRSSMFERVIKKAEN